MSFKYHRAHKDANHKHIVNELEARGFSVGDMSAVGGSFPDLVVARAYYDTVVVELKTPTGSFYLDQLEFLATWQGWAAFATTANDVMNAVSEPEKYCLSDTDCEKILQIVVKLRTKSQAKNPQVSVAHFEKLFKGEK